MSTDIAKRQTPEEQELNKKLSELAELETELVQRELVLATLQAELHSFEREYFRIVGVRYAELDDIEARIAEYFAQRNPENTRVQQEAEKARARAQASASAAEESPVNLNVSKEFKPSERLKKLYREVAKCIHPDLATDEKERAQRQRLMAEANQAYEDGNEKRLQEILREWESSPESVKGEGTAAELIRTIRKIAQIKERLKVIEEQIGTMEKSDLNELRGQVIAAREKGRDILAEMAAKLDQQIADSKQRLENLIV